MNCYSGACSTYPGIIGYERVRSSGRRSVGREGVRLADEGIVPFVVDSGVDEPTVHAPSAVSWRRKQVPVWFKTYVYAQSPRKSNT